jgi:hypothetical protein
MSEEIYGGTTVWVGGGPQSALVPTITTSRKSTAIASQK